METAIRGYFDACNAGDEEKIKSYFVPEAAHYFPRSAFPAMRGRNAIATAWSTCVRDWGSRWTVDALVVDADTREAVIEWTHFKAKLGTYLRGAEWYRFDEAGRIIEIRAYYAAPTSSDGLPHELGDYDYAGRGYPIAPSAVS